MNPTRQNGQGKDKKKSNNPQKQKGEKKINPNQEKNSPKKEKRNGNNPKPKEKQNKSLTPTQKNQKQKKSKNYVALDHSHKKPTLLSYICIFLGLGWLSVFPIMILFRQILWKYFHSFFVLFICLFILSAIYPIQRNLQLSLFYQFGTWMTNVCTSYFSFKVEFEDYSLINNCGPSLFAVEPHGVLPVTLYWGTLNLLTKHKFLCCLSSSILSIPIMKHFLTWSGAISADKNNLIQYLSQGYSLNICPGGVQEVKYLNNSNIMILFLKSRLGFTKLALEQGVCIIPVLTFGLHKIYDYYLFSDWDKNDFFVTIGRKLGFLPMIFFGLGGIPFAQPKPSPLTVVIGKPIYLPKIEKPSVEVIQKYHEIFLDEMRRVFEENKDAHGMSDFTMRIE
jgi:diacylglycerol O-acyltransferase 2, plant